MPSRRTADVVLFDLDGVLTSQDTFTVLVGRRLRRSPWRLLLAGPALPGLLLFAHSPRVRGALARYVVRVALLGAPQVRVRQDLTALGIEFAARPSWILADGVQRARAHADRGDRVIVVTASERCLARTLLDRLGLHDAELIASELAADRLGLRLRPHNYGARKAEALREAGVAPPWRVMFTDSVADLPTLRAAERAVLVNPSPRTEAAVRRVLGAAVTTERWT